MHSRGIAVAFVFLTTLFSSSAFAKQQTLPWQTGHLVDMKKSSCGLLSRCLDLSIETDDFYYLCQWSRERRGHWYKFPDLRSAATVEFSIRTRDVVLRTPDGKKYRLQLLQKQLKPFLIETRPQPTA